VSSRAVPDGLESSRAEQRAWLAGLSDEDRRALIRGQGLPSRRKRLSEIVRGVSDEAAALFVLLERAGGQRRVGSFRDTFVGGFVAESAAELAELSLAEVVGAGDVAVVRLTPAADGVAVVASWSRHEGTGDRPGMAAR
jgi:hypothetical protein